MVSEMFLSGYCRQMDGSRTVTVELDNGVIDCVDCSFETCIYRQSCPIAKQIDELQA